MEMLLLRNKGKKKRKMEMEMGMKIAKAAMESAYLELQELRISFSIRFSSEDSKD